MSFVRWAPVFAAGFASLAASLLSSGAQPSGHSSSSDASSNGCMQCHAGIESMHPEADLSCVDCHGGNASTKNKLEAHPASTRAEDSDERVAARDDNLIWRRFENPMDLRVAAQVCGPCHEDQVRRVHTSLHATTAGHLSDGFYENGLLAKKGSTYGIFGATSGSATAGDIKELFPIPPFRESGPRDRLSTHYGDLARKECMQCHLWSEGRAVDGRVGFDGDYRGEGCAACHVTYALDGLSESADKSAQRSEPGHPRVHAMTRAPSTDTCTSCHYGDASIGLNFRGLSQLPPGAPGGPEIPGTTDVLRNRQFYLDDPSLVPPDVHHERGMHCIDCHTQNDVMGDGRLYGAMEHAVEIGCVDCHGSFRAAATLRTRRGTPLEHLSRIGERVVLTSKVDGAQHDVPQLVHVLDPDRPEYNDRAAQAMTKQHESLECHLCHSAWNPNFMGFHFDRNESLTQLDLLSGLKTKGRVTTQEKVFATWKGFYAGLDEAGRFAPYLTGFSTMGTVRDERGQVLIDQALPVTASGLSGLTQIHHQMHTVRPTSRACVECHRSSTTWGLGSVNFRLGRKLAFVADRRGLEVVAIDRAQISASVPIAKFVLPDIVDLELDCDPLQGRARFVFAAEGFRGIHVLDVRDPRTPRRTQFIATIQPKGFALAGKHLYVADGVGGLRIFEWSARERLEQVAQVPTFDANSVRVQWPHAFVADGAGGVLVVDIRRPSEPKVVGGTRLHDAETAVDAATHVEVLFQNSRPISEDGRPVDQRTKPRMLLAVLDERDGLYLFDATEPSQLEQLHPQREDRSRARRFEVSWRGMVLASHVDIAEPQGGSKTREGDFVYLLGEADNGNAQATSRLSIFEVTEPKRVRPIATLPSGLSTEMLAGGAYFNAPFLQSLMFAPGSEGVFASDVTISAEPVQLGTLAALRECYVVALEEFPLDKQLDEAGRALKDTSHVGSRWLSLTEIERLLLVPGDILGTLKPHARPDEIPGATARLHFERCDADHSGVLDGDELTRAGSSFDLDGDGRIVLAELAGSAGLEDRATTRVTPPPPSNFLSTRVDRDGDLARLFDGLAPLEFDLDADRRLNVSELSRALFAALDLDGDRGLSIDELSRHPGTWRELRFRGAVLALFEALDDNKDGRIQAKELTLADDERRALDRDGSGFLELGPLTQPAAERAGYFALDSEWPTRRPLFVQLAPRITVEQLLTAFDADKSGTLTAREMKRRGDLFRELDANRDDIVDATELAARVRIVDANGVEVLPDGFVERWDLDGSGKVEPDELPSVLRTLLR
ncbi:MAG: hypothetical protein IT454_01720 [Planctomycetes bacterium]|nr:hypothetical protein [Planctomycetota bacterium]